MKWHKNNLSPKIIITKWWTKGVRWYSMDENIQTFALSNV